MVHISFLVPLEMIFTQLWFWMLVAAVVALAFGIFLYEITRTATGSAPVWGILFIVLGTILFVMAMVVAGLQYYNFIPVLETETESEGSKQRMSYRRRFYQAQE